MILIIHEDNVVKKVLVDKVISNNYNNLNLSIVVLKLSNIYINELLVWCHVNVENDLNYIYIEKLKNYTHCLHSYIPKGNYFPDEIGYVEDSIFIKINKEIKYPTWQMSSYVGCVNTAFLNKLDKDLFKIKSFDYLINCIAKKYQQDGLFCYSDPNLIDEDHIFLLENCSASIDTLFKFVKNNYKKTWVLVLFVNLMVFEKKIYLYSFLKSILFEVRRNKYPKVELYNKSSYENKSNHTIDVLIPTIGRKKYLYDVLKDLSVQTYLPKKVIIVEQNPVDESKTELNFLFDEFWPFEIKHIFTHQTGACNARNIGLEVVSSEWLFFADDDIRFDSTLFEKLSAKINKFDHCVYTLSCLQKNDKKTLFNEIQWSTFGSGCSFVKSSVLKGLKFDLVYEHNFGEDGDFGMQLRNKGYDIIYLPEPSLLHLKAPIGGFRMKYTQPWENEKIKPKPTPTILYFVLKYKTKQQLFGYKTLLFIKFYKLQTIKSPIKYFINFKKQWQVSLKWANKLKTQ